MTISGNGGLRVAGPECRPTHGGLKSVADVQENSGNDWLKGLEWDELPCDYDPQVVSGQCPPLPEQRKTAARGFDTKYSDPFTVYAGWECNSLSADDAWANANALLERNWWRTVERTLWTGLDQDDNTVRETLATSGPTDLTPDAGAVDITAGIAMLESFFSDCSDCRPILHANRGVATFIAERGLLAWTGEEHVLDGTGSQVSVAAGYQASGPGGVAADPGEAWMYVTGGITVVHGPSFFAPPEGDLAGAVNRLTNDITVFAERTAAIMIGCCVGAVKVKLNSCCC